MTDFVTDGYYRQICSQQEEIAELKQKLAEMSDEIDRYRGEALLLRTENYSLKNKIELFDSMSGIPIGYVVEGKCKFEWNSKLIPDGTPLFLPQRKETVAYWKSKCAESR